MDLSDTTDQPLMFFHCRPHWGGFGDLFRTHMFLNAGNIGDFAAPERMTAEELLGEMRLSYGLGLAFRDGFISRVCLILKSDLGRISSNLTGFAKEFINIGFHIRFRTQQT